MSIPTLMASGELPPGIHLTTIAELEIFFGQSNSKRRQLMKGLKKALKILKGAHVSKVFIDGSFTTDKEEPKDVDGCWSSLGVDVQELDSRFWDFESTEDFELKRQAIKNEFGIDFFIAEIIEGGSGKPFPEFFQTNRDGDPKGIIQINL
jgi:hypothetical protein